MVEVKEIHSKRELKDFVKFPFTLYKESKYWTPPIISEELKGFDKTINPVFKNADAQFFLAYKNNTIVGRIAVIINWLEVKKQRVKKIRFGWFDFIDDLQVSKLLLEKVQEIGKSYQLDYSEGPVGFSNLDKVGVIIEGFEDITTMVSWYNHSYYVKHYETHGFKPEKYYRESKFSFSNVNPDAFSKANDLIKQRYKLKALNFTKTSQVMPYVDEMFGLFNASYASLSSFVEITDIQKAYFKKKFISFVNPEYIKFVLDANNTIIAFAIVLPSFSEALRKANGKLFPFGFRHILKAKKQSKEAIFYLIGVHPEYQNKGVHAVIFKQYYDTFVSKGIKTCYRTPELEDNIAIKNIWKHFNPEIYRRRATYKKIL